MPAIIKKKRSPEQVSEDFSFLPDQPNSQNEDFSFLPDRKEDTSFLPDQPSILDRIKSKLPSLEDVKNSVVDAALPKLSIDPESPQYPSLPPKKDNKLDFLTEKTADASNPLISLLIRTDLGKRAVQDVAAGMAGTVRGTLAAEPAIESFFGMKTPIKEPISNLAGVYDKLQKDLQPPDPNYIDQLIQGGASSAVFFLPGFGVAKGINALSNAGALAAKLAPYLGTAAMTVFEAATESGSVYQDRVGQIGEKAASDEAAKAFAYNIGLIGLTNHLADYFKAGKTVVQAILKAAPFEAIQEAGQSLISSSAKGEPPNLKEILTSGSIGLIFGGAMGGVGAAGMAGQETNPNLQKMVDDMIANYRGRSVQPSPNIDDLGGGTPPGTPPGPASPISPGIPGGGAGSVIPGENVPGGTLSTAIKPTKPVLPPSGAQFLVNSMPKLAGVVENLSKTSDSESLQKSVTEAVAKAEAAKIAGIAPEQAELAAIEHIDSQLRSGAIAPQIEPQAVVEVSKPKPVKYDNRGFPVRKPGSVVQTIEVEGVEPYKVKHQEVMDRAKAIYEEDLRDWQGKQDLVSDLIRKVRIKPEPAVGDVIPEQGEWDALPLNLKDAKNGLTASQIVQRVNESPLEYGLSEGEEITVSDVYAYGQKENKTPMPTFNGKYYGDAIREIESDLQMNAEGRQYPDFAPAEPDYPELTPEGYPKSWQEQTSPENLFQVPQENLTQRYRRLVDEGKAQGLNPIQAIKYAKDKLAQPSQAASGPKAQQIEFGAPGGVEGFGRGRRGESELFEPKSPYQLELEFDKNLDDAYTKSKTEIDQAYGGKEEFKKALKSIGENKGYSGDLRNLQKRMEIYREIKKKGFYGIVGSKVKNASDIADLTAIARNPAVEILQFAFLKDGKIVAHHAFTLGIPDFIPVPEALIKKINALSQELKADEVIGIHNHPSGNSTPSGRGGDTSLNIELTKRIKNYKYHIVHNHEQFAVIHPDGGYHFEKYSKAQPKYTPDGLVLMNTPDKVASYVNKNFKENKAMVMYLDMQNNIHAHEYLDLKSKNIGKFIGDRMRAYKVPQYIVALTPKESLPQGYVREMAYSLPYGLLDIVTVEKNGHTSLVNSTGVPGFQPSAHAQGQFKGKDIFRFIEEASGLPIEKVNELMKLSEPAGEYGPSPQWYSALESAVKDRMPNKSSGEQILGLIQNTPGVKQEEIDWLGLPEFLKGKESVTKEEVLKFIRENNVEIKEVMKSEKPPEGKTDFGNLDIRTKFEKYQLPGGENYRELLLTLPTENPLGKGWDARELQRIKAGKSETFRSPHFPEENILAHIRFNDRVDAEGKKVLFIEEIQSDWHQQGREVGYKGEIKSRYKEFRDFLRSKGASEVDAMNPSISILEQYGADASMINRFDRELKNIRGIPVPDAPFKKTWHELALKWMLRYATENGYDKIAWTTGEQQADRYDLGHQVRDIEWTTQDKYTGRKTLSIYPKEGNVIELGIDDNGIAGGVRKGLSGTQFDGKHVSDIIGKEIGRRILAETYGHLSGQGLKIGGEGMKGFYDQMIPVFLNKYTKKWGGRVGETSIKAPVKGFPEFTKDRFEKVWGLEITPAMKESVMRGQALFESRASYGGEQYHKERKDRGLLNIANIIRKTPDVDSITITARNADRNKFLILNIEHSGKSGLIDRPPSEFPGVTIWDWRRKEPTRHIVESDWITADEIEPVIKEIAKNYNAIDILRINDNVNKEIRWIFKTNLNSRKSYDPAIIRKTYGDEGNQNLLREKVFPYGESQLSKGGQPIDKFETIETPEEQKARSEFKLSDEGLKIIKKYAERVGERYLPRGAKGVFHPETTNIRVNALNNLSTVSHEVTHYLDQEIGFTTKLLGTVGVSKTGNPIYDPKYKPLRKELTDIYVEYYPASLRSHRLKKRMREGIATFLQKYVEMPKVIEEKYPKLVSTFLKSGGEFYSPEFPSLIKDMHSVIADYQKLDPLQKIATRVTSKFQQGKIKDSFLNWQDKFVQETIDNKWPIEKLAKLGGVQRTQKDPSLWIRMYDNSSVTILNNIRGKRGFWVYKNGGFQKVSDNNIKTLVDALKSKGLTDDFGYWLVARRQHFDYLRLDELQRSAEEAAIQLNDIRENPGAVTKTEIDELRKKIGDYKRLKQTLDKDAFDRNVVTQAYSKDAEVFKPYADMFDKFNQANLEMMADPEVGLLTPKQYAEYSAKDGYASFKRDVYDEIIGPEEPNLPQFRVGRTKVSSTIGRTGSELSIINPLASLVSDHAEVMRKSLKQIVYNKIAGLAPQFPDLFQRQELKPSIDQRSGAILYPQERDPNIIMARGPNGERIPYLVSQEIKKIVDELLTYQNVSALEMLVRTANRWFTKGTTGSYPLFAPTNFLIDQITATAQSRNKYIPVYDALKELYQSLIKRESADHQFEQEYLILGGERQTFAKWQDLDPDELIRAINGERTKLQKVQDIIEAGGNILALPSQMSEIVTRMAEYIKSRKAGNSQVIAMEDAGRVTVPFHHRGRYGSGTAGQTFVKSVPFMNPGIQALAQYYRSVNQGDTRNRALFTTLAVIAASVGASIYMMGNATSDQKKEYKDLEVNELANYIWLPASNGKDLIRVRAPEQMLVFATLINMALWDSQMHARYSKGDYLDAVTAFLPDQVDLTDPRRMFLSTLPQIIKPLVNVIYNKKDWPKPRPLVSLGLEYKEPRFQFNDNTSKFSKWLGDKLNLSPIKIDYLIEGYFGRVTRFVTGKEIKNPFIREWYFTAGRNLQDYYEMKQVTNALSNSLKHGDRSFTEFEKRQIEDQKKKVSKIDKLLDKYRKPKEPMTDYEKQLLRNEILNEVSMFRQGVKVQ